MESKICSFCKQEKPLIQFYRHTISKGTYRGECIVCVRNKQNTYANMDEETLIIYKENKQQQKEKRRPQVTANHKKAVDNWKDKNKEYMKDYQLQHNYGITLKRRNEILEEQGHKCAVCKGPKGNKDWHLDHNHITKQVRGILCSKCNLLLGLAKDNPAILTAAAMYLISTEPHLGKWPATTYTLGLAVVQ